MQAQRQGSKQAGQDLMGASGCDQEERNKQMQDSLLASFSVAQKEYIIENLYPDLSRALVHFIAEAKRLNKI